MSKSINWPLEPRGHHCAIRRRWPASGDRRRFRWKWPSKPPPTTHHPPPTTHHLPPTTHYLPPAGLVLKSVAAPARGQCSSRGALVRCWVVGKVLSCCCCCFGGFGRWKYCRLRAEAGCERVKSVEIRWRISLWKTLFVCEGLGFGRESVFRKFRFFCTNFTLG